MAFAIRHTERVRRLVLVGAPAGLDKSLPLFPRLWGNPISGRLIGKLVVNTKSPEDVRKRAFPLLVAHPERLSVEFLELSLAAQKLAGTDVAAHTMLRSVSTLRGWRDHLLMRDDLAKLPLPTLFVWGGKDAFAPPSSGVDMVARMPDARIETIENAGHLPHLDDPLAIAENINPFLAS